MNTILPISMKNIHEYLFLLILNADILCIFSEIECYTTPRDIIYFFIFKAGAA